MSCTVIIPSDYNVTLTFQGREVKTNLVQLASAQKMLKLHRVGIQFKLSPVTFLNRLFGTRKSAKFWQGYLKGVLG